jgi:hypothetical protein
MGGGAWPFLVGGVICLVNSVNERDLSLLNSNANFTKKKVFRFFLIYFLELIFSFFFFFF